jgi:hypothetical protein
MAFNKFHVYLKFFTRVLLLLFYYQKTETEFCISFNLSSENEIVTSLYIIIMFLIMNSDFDK